MSSNEIQQSATKIGDFLEKRDLVGATNEFMKELYAIEQSGGTLSDKSRDEANFFGALLKEDSDLRGKNLPGLEIVENGKVITFRPQISPSDGLSQGPSFWMKDSAYAKEHPVNGQHKLTRSDFAAPSSPDESSPVDGKYLQGSLVQNEKAAADYPQPHYIYDGGLAKQAVQPPRNVDGTLDFNRLSQSIEGPMMSGFQRRDYNMQGFFVRTDISLPVNTPQNEIIKGTLPSGDPISGRILPVGNELHFFGVTKPESTGHGSIQVPLDIRLH